jgi:hypothetical protein
VERHTKKIRAPPSNIIMVNIGGTSTSDVMQQSSEPSHGQQSSSQPHVVLATTHPNAVTTTTSATGTPLTRDMVMRRPEARRWTRFWRFLGCVSAVNESNH